MHTYKDLLRALDRLFEEVTPETPEEVDAYLREEGYDPDQVGKKFMAIAEKAIAEAEKRERDRELTALNNARKEINLVSIPITLPREELLRLIIEIFQSLNMDIAGGAAYRNYEDLSTEDLRSMLQELTYLSNSSTINGLEEK